MLIPNNYPLKRLGISWEISEFHGWGVFALNLARTYFKNFNQHLKLLQAPNIDIEKFPFLGASLSEWEANYQKYETKPNKNIHDDLTIIHSLGNDFVCTNSRHWGKRNIGFIFFEQSLFSSEGLARAQQFDLIVAGSRWNAEILAKAGVRKISYVMQGVDTKLFRQSVPRSTAERFVIFSGGKLEFRKGQDIILAAFKVFHKKYPDSVLLTSWNSPWAETSQDLTHSPLGFGAPNIINNQIDVDEWCSRSGVPNSAFIHLGPTPNTLMPKIYDGVDIAIFTNRAEGGTNLVAMEAMASGVPTILSANTGHLDLISTNNCFILAQQKGYDIPALKGWGESDIAEVVQKLEYAYHHRSILPQVGNQGRKFIEQFSWEQQMLQLINTSANFY